MAFSLHFLTLTLALAFIHPLNGQLSFADKYVQSFLPLDLNKTNFTLADAKNLLTDKCLKANRTAEIKFENIENAAKTLQQCGENIGDMSMLLTEIEEARPTGDLDLVFKKHCDNLPKIKECLKQFNDQWILCLTPAERQQNFVVMKIVQRLLDFACQKSGTYLTVFIAEEGPECFEMHNENITNCLNATLSSYQLPMLAMAPPTELPELVITPQHCIDMYHVENCLLASVEQCNSMTPAAITESLFKYVRNETKCQEEIDKVIGCQEPNCAQLRNAATVEGARSWLLCMHVAGVVMIIRGIIWKV